MDDLNAVTRRLWHVTVGAGFSAAMVAFAYLWAGWVTAIVFSAGFVTGWVLWLARRSPANFAAIKLPYLVSLAAYVVHRIDEELSGFVPAIEQLTGAEPVDVTSPLSIVLVVFSVAWMLSPVLIRRGHPLGYYGAWTLFAGFGILEVAHFVFPLLTDDPYGYFPGMWTAPLIIAAGWWGLIRMWKGGPSPEQQRDTDRAGIDVRPERRLEGERDTRSGEPDREQHAEGHTGHTQPSRQGPVEQ